MGPDKKNKLSVCRILKKISLCPHSNIIKTSDLIIKTFSGNELILANYTLEGI